MACPYFYPVGRFVADLGPPSAILPLGDAWSGTCRARTGPPQSPGEEQLRHLCNFGYARGRCDRFPLQDAGSDAVRFTIAGDDGSSLRIYYVEERDHHPFAHGPLEYLLAGRGFLDKPKSEILARQAEAYAESYLRRKHEALPR